MKDRSGNSMRYEYAKSDDGAEVLPVTIRYTLSNTTSGDYST